MERSIKMLNWIVLGVLLINNVIIPGNFLTNAQEAVYTPVEDSADFTYTEEYSKDEVNYIHEGDNDSLNPNYDMQNLVSHMMKLHTSNTDTFNLTFMVGGEIYKVIEIQSGYTATVPVDLPIGTVEGWYLTGEDEPFDFSTPITDNMTLYAKFSSCAEGYEKTDDGNCELAYTVTVQIEGEGDIVIKYVSVEDLKHKLKTQSETWEIEVLDDISALADGATITGEWVSPEECFSVRNGNTIDGYKYKEKESGIEKCGLEMRIPTKIDGVVIKTVYKSAFKTQNNPVYNIKKLPNFVENIGDSAFYGQSIEVRLPSTIKSIVTNAFHTAIYSDELKSLFVLPESVESIGNNAFRWNTFEKILLNNSNNEVNLTIDNGAFYFNKNAHDPKQGYIIGDINRVTNNDTGNIVFDQVYSVVFKDGDTNLNLDSDDYAFTMGGKFYFVDGKVINKSVSKDYYNFTGWQDEQGNVYTTVTVSKDSVYNALWEPINDANENGIADEEEKYSVLIHYKRVDGKTVKGDTFVEDLSVGYEYSVESPIIPYYTADNLIVSGVIVKENIEVTVLYKPNTDTNKDGIADEEQNLNIGGHKYSGGGGRKSVQNKSNQNGISHGSASNRQIETQNDKGQKIPELDMEIYDPNYSYEQNQAYQFAYKNGITTQLNIKNANINGKLTRIQMAKILSYYAINVLGQTPDLTKGTHKFADVSVGLDNIYNNGVSLAYNLGIMGINIKDNKFRPNSYVTRAEFTTALSRLLYGINDGTGKTKYYEPHISKLYNEGILNDTNPNIKELRGYVILMLMRSMK